jgi:ribosomal RNA-processing protein 12
MKLTTGTDPNQASRKRKPGQDASHFKTDKSGKLIIDEPSTNGAGTTSLSAASGGDGGDRGDAYLANQMAVGGAVRDAKGNLKFNKNTKRGREVEKEYEDTYSGGVLDKEEIVKKKKREVTKLGEEFRSKVSFPFLFFSFFSDEL